MKPRNAFTGLRGSQWLSATMSTLAIALGVAVLLGWHAHSPRLTGWVAGTTPMFYNTAICLVILGAALLGIILDRRRLSTVLAILTGLLPLLMLFEDVVGVSLGIDELLMKSGGSWPHPGRIAPNSAACLLLLSAAILCMQRRDRWRTFASPLLLSLAFGLSGVSVAGYLTGFNTFGWGQFVPMALPTSVGLLLLSLGALSLLFRNAEDSVTGGPSWLYMTVAVASIVMTVSLWQALAAEEHARIERAVAGQMDVVRTSLIVDMDLRIGSLARMGRRWARAGKPAGRQREFEAAELAKDIRGFQAIGWVDPDFHVLSIYPRLQNDAMLGGDLTHDPNWRLALESARQTRHTIVSRSIRRQAGGAGINAYVPVYRGSDWQGFLVAVFRFRDLFPIVVDPTMSPGYSMAIYEGDEEVYFHGSRGDQSGRFWERQSSLQVENANWTLKLWPTSSGLVAQESAASNIVLAAGILLSVLLGWAVHLAQAARLKREAAEQARDALAKEVKERRRAEQELDQFFSLAPDMLCIAGFDGYFKRINAVWEDTLGIPLDRLLAEPFKNFLHPGDGDATSGVVNDQKSGARILSFENRYRAVDGSYRWLRWNSQANPERQLIFAAARDVTEEKIAAEELRRGRDELEQRVRERTADLELANRTLFEREELFRRLFEDSPIGTALIDTDHHLTHVNKAFCELLACEASELQGLTLKDITYHDDFQVGNGLLRQMIGGQIPHYSLTNRYLRKDREIVWGELTATILRDQRGTPVTVLGMIENVTERHRDEERIAELNRELQSRVDELTAINQELESFNYSVSHDLRAPLRHIDGFSKILFEEQRDQLPGSAQRYLNLIREGARRMGRMVDELLELSRTSRKELTRHPTGLNSLVDDVLADLAPELKGREIEWRIGELPFLDCDPILTRQVFANVISNAVKFSRPRHPAVIEVGQIGTQGGSVVFVRDNGVGFSMKYSGKLFGVFQRLHRQEDFEGTGAGLATAQRIVQKHGGRIWAEAELDKGATFYFTLAPTEAQVLEDEKQQDKVLVGAR